MKVNIKSNGQMQERHLPDKVSELPLGQFLELDKAYASGNAEAIVAAWLTISIEEVRSMPASAYNQIISAVSWYNLDVQELVVNSQYPRHINEKLLPTADNFEDNVSLSQLLSFDEWQGKESDHVVACAALCGHLLLGGRFDGKKMQEYIREAKQVPAVLGFPIANFFLIERKRRLPKSMPPSSRKTTTSRRIFLTLLVMAGLTSLIALLAAMFYFGTR